MQSNKTLKTLEASGVKTVLIKTDETQYWRSDIVKKAKKIFGYALVDLTQPTNLCSIQVSYAYEMVYYRVMNAEKFNEDELTEIENVVDDNGYYNDSENCQIVREWSDMEFEDVKEMLVGNPIEI